MTYIEALKSGYEIADTKYQRGYVSRRCNIEAQTVKTAGGARKGDFYINAPCWESSQYCYRCYLQKKES